MKFRYMVSGFVLGAAATLVGAQAFSQQDSEKLATQPGPEDMEKMMTLWQEMATPGAAHKKLEYFVGSWTSKTHIWMAGPDAPPTVTEGKSTVTPIMGGRYYKDEHEGTFMGQPMSGMGITGYDNYKKKYTLLWIDNMGTAMSTGEGTIDQTGTVWSYFGSMDEWTTGEHDKTVKYLVRIVDENHYEFEIHDLAIVPGETKVVQVTYERVTE